MAKRREAVVIGSDNVFEDLGLTDAGERQLRTRLAMELNESIARQGLTQVRVAERFGIPQPHISELRHYKLSRFSCERLLRFLTLLDHDVEIVIRPKATRRAAGTLSVSAT